MASALGAGQAQGHRARQERVGASPVTPGDLEGDRGHGRGGGQVGGIGDPIEVAGVERHEPPGRVEDVHHG